MQLVSTYIDVPYRILIGTKAGELTGSKITIVGTPSPFGNDIYDIIDINSQLLDKYFGEEKDDN